MDSRDNRNLDGFDRDDLVVINDFVPEDNHHPLLGYYVHQTRRRYFSIIAGAVAISALLSFALAWAIISSKPVQLTLALPTTASTADAITTGQVSLTESELKDAARQLGGTFFWTGSETNATYTLNRNAPGEDFIRYLPGGQGLSDNAQNYRVIATYKDPTAYATLTEAAKLKTGVSITNPDGSLVYYARTTANHVYMAFQGLDYQIEIFDPKPGASLKLATTPGAVQNLLK